MATAVANVSLAKNAVTVLTTTAAAADTIDLAEVFTITPTKSDARFMIVVNNASGANGAVALSLAAGEFWAKPAAALTGSVAQGVRSAIVVESAKYMKKDGTLALTVTPASGKKLKTDHTLVVSVVQL